MEESGDNYLSAKWFNSHLFTINAAPLKFYLDGFTLNEFYEMVKIIEAYGGELSKPDEPDTFVFCEPGRALRAQKWDRYDIQYFHDSVVAVEPLKLINYKLQLFTKQHIANPMDDDESSHLEIKEENINESLESMDYKLQMSTDEESRSFVDINQSPQLNAKEENNNELQELINYLNDDKLKNSKHNLIHHEHNDNFQDEDCVNSCSSGPEDLLELTDSENLWTAARTRVYSRVIKNSSDVDCLNENEIVDSSAHLQINDENNDNDDKVDTMSCENPPEDDADADDSDDSQATGHSQADDDELNSPSVHLFSTTGENRRRSDGRLKVTFSEEETQKIMKWLIEKNAVPTDTGKKIWREFLDEEILPDRNVTVGNLLGHFRRELKMDPTFIKYMKNMRPSKRPPRSSSARPVILHNRYTDEENRILIQYLIDNDAIHRARSNTVWADCLKKYKTLLHSTRTPTSLCTHFKHKLRHTYAKFTDDPEALRKFQKIEPKMLR